MLFEAMPWLSYHAPKVPSIAAKLQKLRAVGEARAKQRVQKGTSVKDLFHYLVSTYSLFMAVEDDHVV